MAAIRPLTRDYVIATALLLAIFNARPRGLRILDATAPPSSAPPSATHFSPISAAEAALTQAAGAEAVAASVPPLSRSTYRAAAPSSTVAAVPPLSSTYSTVAAVPPPPPQGALELTTPPTQQFRQQPDDEGLLTLSNAALQKLAEDWAHPSLGTLAANKWRAKTLRARLNIHTSLSSSIGRVSHAIRAAEAAALASAVVASAASNAAASPTRLAREARRRLGSAAPGGQDVGIIERYFSCRNRSGTFLEYSADGTGLLRHSRTALLDINGSWVGLCVEAHPLAFPQLAPRRPRCVSVHGVAAARRGLVDYEYQPPGEAPSSARLYAAPLHEQVQVAAPHLKGKLSLLAVHEPRALETLASFDFAAVKVDVVLVCAAGSVAHRDEIVFNMQANGFTRHPRIRGDEVFVGRRARLCGWDPHAEED